MSIVRPGLEQIDGSGATDGQTTVWDGGVWKPSNFPAGVSSIVAGTNVTVDNTDPAHPIVSASGGAGGGVGDHGVKIKKSGTPQTFANSTVVAITWQTTIWDTDVFWSSGAPSRFTIPAGMGGKYLLIGHFSFDLSASFDQLASFGVNGTETISSRARTNAPFAHLSISTELSLAATDYVEMFAYQGSGVSRATSTTANLCEFSIRKLS